MPFAFVFFTAADPNAFALFLRFMLDLQRRFAEMRQARGVGIPLASQLLKS
jgi:hypothetical protein